MKQGGIQFKTHQVRNRHPDHESPQNSLKHDESCLADAVVKADMAKENRRKQTIDCISFEILKSSKHDPAVGRKDSRQDVAMEKRQKEHDNADGKRNRNPVMQCLLGTIHLFRTEILRHKGRNRLHESCSMMNAQTFSATPTPADATTPMPFTIARIIRKEMLTSRS